MNYEARVAKGAAELDRILPGWERKIDLEELDLDSPCRCVLGQLSIDVAGVSGSYGAALMDLCPNVTASEAKMWSEDRGFLTTLGFSDTDIWLHVDSLTEAWKRLIRQRLET